MSIKSVVGGLTRILGSTCLFAAAGFGSLTQAETVLVKYRGEVDLNRFACRSDFTSSFIQRICFDEGERYLLVKMKPGIWYHYCTVSPNVFDGFVEASSKGSYYNDAIKARYACRSENTPAYSTSKERP